LLLVVDVPEVEAEPEVEADPEVDDVLDVPIFILLGQSVRV